MGFCLLNARKHELIHSPGFPSPPFHHIFAPGKPQVIRVGLYQGVDRDGSVGKMTRYGLDGPGIESCRPRWPRGLGHRSVAARLLELRVRILPGAWMFVFCVLHSKDEEAKGRTIRTKNYGKSTKTEQDLCAVLVTKY